ncbi:hypothetical protein THAOC_03354 [Thalassiosira oceanica]|uniref:Uncharacterized protein n=1 Tax=Thalassiosira oceanica TaxID=159749 RepID=K0TBQ9_THAOC|nr:hypothetical protein THAOC_03354 [Thalassiosira oceanica]|eukprot:EJK74940.1 hypothetical protein THAOC_03354 [Thalassiosira oceanica]
MATSDQRNEDVFLYEGGNIAEERKREITRVLFAQQVTKVPHCAFQGCSNLRELQLNEGLKIIGDHAFLGTALQSVTLPSTVIELLYRAFSQSLRSVTPLPSTVIELGYGAFLGCGVLTKVQLNEGLQVIGNSAFHSCWALQSLTIPSTVNKLADQWAFYPSSSNLSEVIILGGERFLHQDFLDRGIFSGGLLNQLAIREYIFLYENFVREHAYSTLKLNSLKISISMVERMSRLSHECRVSVEESLRHLGLMQDGTFLVCFPVVEVVVDSLDSSLESMSVDSLDTDLDEGGTDPDYEIQDTDLETAKSLYKVLQLVAFHELQESSILIELAMWKSRIDEDRARADCRAPIPDPAKSLIMEYGGFAGFLTPAIVEDA